MYNNFNEKRKRIETQNMKFKGVSIRYIWNRMAEKYDGYMEYFVENEKIVSSLILPVTA